MSALAGKTARTPQLIAVLVAAGALTFAGGCGGGGSDRDKATATVKDFLSAIADGDGGKACDQLTGPARRDFLDGTQTTDCGAAAKRVSDQLSDDEKQKLRDAKVTVDLKADLKRKAQGASPGDVSQLQAEANGNDAVAHVVGGNDVPLSKVNGKFEITSFDLGG